jgi:hypothetical protein
LTINVDLLLLVQKLSAVGINKSKRGHHIDIFNDLATKVKIAEQMTHNTAIVKM